MGDPSAGVFQDLKIEPLREVFDAFASSMKTTRLHSGRSDGLPQVRAPRRTTEMKR
ncbi:MAG: hypothetical protein ACREBT_04390 [Thermoplasmata archaeon]